MRKPSTTTGGRLMDLRTAAAYVGCSYWTLRDLALNGHVPIVRIPSPRATDGRALRRIFIDRRDLDTLIERWKEVNSDSGPTDRPRTGGPDGNALQPGHRVVDQKYYRNGRGTRESSRSTKERVAKRLLKVRKGDIERGLPVDPKLNRIRFEEAAEDLKTEYAVNGRRSADELERRIRLHLMPHFGGRRLATIRTPDINTFILKRQADVIVSGEGDDRRERTFSNGEINQQLEHVLAHLPPAVRPAVQFAYITGWRIPSEVLLLQWRHVDFEARVVRLDAHTTKNDEGRLPLHRRVASAPGGSEGRARPAQSRGRALSLGLQPHRQESQRQANHSIHEGVEKGLREGGLSRPHSA
jgi:integrase